MCVCAGVCSRRGQRRNLWPTKSQIAKNTWEWRESKRKDKKRQRWTRHCSEGAYSLDDPTCTVRESTHLCKPAWDICEGKGTSRSHLYIYIDISADPFRLESLKHAIFIVVCFCLARGPKTNVFGEA